MVDGKVRSTDCVISTGNSEGERVTSSPFSSLGCGAVALMSVSHSNVCAGSDVVVGSETETVGAVEGRPPRLDSATTCLTRFSSRLTRSLKATFSSRRLAKSGSLVWGTSESGEGASMMGFTSTSAGGGATLARLTPFDELTISGGMPRSFASERTLCAGEASRSAEGAQVLRAGGGVSPDRSARFSASSSMTRRSRFARCTFR